MTPEQIAEARARCEKATEGPWTVTVEEHERDGDKQYGMIAINEISRTLHDSEWADAEEWDRDLANAEFIAHARTDLPAALDALEAARKRVDELTSGIGFRLSLGGDVLTLLQDGLISRAKAAELLAEWISTGRIERMPQAISQLPDDVIPVERIAELEADNARLRAALEKLLSLATAIECEVVAAGTAADCVRQYVKAALEGGKG